jgi:hypothetical protein
MTRARDTTRLVSATNYEGVVAADEFAVIDTSPKVISANFTLDSTNAGANDALVSINKTHVRVDTGATLDIADDRHLVINHYNLPHTVV